MKKLYIWLLLILSIVILIAGKAHRDNNLEKGIVSAEERNKQLIAEQKEKVEGAKATWLGKQEARVYVIGSSVAIGKGASNRKTTSWAGLLRADFEQTNPDVTFSNLGVSGYTTKDILEKGVVEDLIRPDVVIFETSLINNFTKISLADSTKQIKEIHDKISAKTPNARVVLLPPNPIILLPLTNGVPVENRTDKDGYSYEEFVKASGQYSKAQNWEYIDFWADFEQGIEDKGITLKTLLDKDGVHPNDTGYKLWYDSIKGYFRIKD
ncbi:SGNH/GDSL hydrolase family protein [Sporosarcina sp. E16_8]|uniref:GDSL-type esterase/lipase family protein n=1 Tax=Sporosarcina sp. E16_8 TaxID=2789295 RepID=UPI001A93071D|nr:SGNH/GDSL hydrolase family protein [Sporosarcina sp. E16_8]